MAMLNCSFCGKNDQQVAKLAAGPGGLYICNECVEACQLYMKGAEVPPSEFDPRTWDTERILGALRALDDTAEAYRGHLANAVDALRARGISWARIAEPLGVSRQSAWERFS